MKLDASKIDASEVIKWWTENVRARSDSNKSILREAARDFIGLKRAFGDNERRNFYLLMLDPKSRLNVAILNAVQELAWCADNLKSDRREIAEIKGVIAEVLEPLREAVIGCYPPPPPGYDNDTWIILRQWKSKTSKAIKAIPNTIEDTACEEDDTSLQVKRLRREIEQGLAEIAKRLQKMWTKDDARTHRNEGRDEENFEVIIGRVERLWERLLERLSEERETKRNPQDDAAALVNDVYNTDRIWKSPFPGETKNPRRSVNAACEYVRFKCSKTDTEFYDRCMDARTAISNLGKTKAKIESLWRTIINKKAKPSVRGDRSNKRKTYYKSDMRRYAEEHGGDPERMIYPTLPY